MTLDKIYLTIESTDVANLTYVILEFGSNMDEKFNLRIEDLKTLDTISNFQQIRFCITTERSYVMLDFLQNAFKSMSFEVISESVGLDGQKLLIAKRPLKNNLNRNHIVHNEGHRDQLLGFNQSEYMSGSGQMFNTPRNLSPYQQQWNNPESIELNKNVSIIADRVKGIENAISTINQRNLSQSDFFNSKIAEIEKRHSNLSAFTESMFHFLSKHNGVLDDKEIEELRNRLNVLLKPIDPFSSDKQTPNVSELRPPQKSNNPMEDSLERLAKANGKS